MILLIISKDAMKKANKILDFDQDKVIMFREEQSLLKTSSGKSLKREQLLMSFVCLLKMSALKMTKKGCFEITQAILPLQCR